MSARGRSLLAVTGAAFEARIASGDQVSVLCSGGDPARLHALLDALDPDDFRAIVSFGVAGGLDTELRPGDIVLADTVVADTGTWRANPALNEAVQSSFPAAGIKVHRSTIAGVDRPTMTLQAKASLRMQTGADAVDMETHVAAGYAARNDLPWMAVRAICDPADRVLPPLSTAGLKPDGRIDIAACLHNLARHPGQLPALIRTALETAVAVAALRRARRVLGPGFGLGSADFR